jgi:hypothetical protein
MTSPTSQEQQSGHTPGPWLVIEDTEWPFNPRVESQGGSVIVSERRMAFSSSAKTLAAIMDGHHMGKDRAEAVRLNALQMANLRLIAAAPELLEALIALASEEGGDMQDVLRARAAISKATGEAA